MYYPDYTNMKNEFSKYASETREEGYMIEISTKRATALADAAVLYSRNDRSRYVPNGYFSDAELTLFEIMCRVYRAGMTDKDQG